MDTSPDALMPAEDRILAASWATYNGRKRLIARGDALAILGKGHPLRSEVEAMPCLGEHRVGYCCGSVVDAAAILAALASPDKGEPHASD